MFIPPEFIRQLQDQLTIFDVVSKYMPLNRQGTRYYGSCPFHNEKTPSFHIDMHKNTYTCFGCKEYGNIYTFVQKIKSVDFVTAVEILATQANLVIPKASAHDVENQIIQQEYFRIMQAAQDFFHQQLFSDHGKVAQRYINERHINLDSVKKFGLGFTGIGRNQLKNHMLELGFTVEQLVTVSLLNEKYESPFFINRLMFPIYNKQKKVIAFGGRTLDGHDAKYINSRDTPIYNKGKNLYGIAQALESRNRNDPVIVVEGNIDVVMMHQYGFDKTVACLGTALTPDQVKTMWNLSSVPIVCFDGDAAGIKAARETAYHTLPILKTGCSLQFLTLPDRLDPDQFLNQYGPEKFKTALQHALPLSRQVWNTLSDQYPKSTPETKALWHDEVKKKLLSIDHDVIRHEYFNVFKEWGYEPIIDVPELTRNYNAVPYDQAPHSQPMPVIPRSPPHNKQSFQSYNKIKKSAVRPQVNMKDTQARILITLLLYYPGILHDVFEELSHLNFKDVKMEQIKSVLLNFINQESVHSQQNLQHHMNKIDDTIYPSFPLTDVIKHYKQLKTETTDDSCAKKIWKECYEIYIKSLQTYKLVSRKNIE